MSASETSAIETRLIKALGHPLRQRILEQLNEREASPSILAEQLNERLGNVSYHVKFLLEHDAIELVGTKPARGAIEHFYRATVRPYIDDEHWSRLPVSVRRTIFDQTLQKIWDHVIEAGPSGGLDDPRTHISWTTLDLDPEGRDEVADLLAGALEQVLEIQAEAVGRLAELPADERDSERTELTVMHYHRPRVEEKTSKRRRGKARPGARANKP
jgi:DNA-binding transcriptional ArsR family regulator